MTADEYLLGVIKKYRIVGDIDPFTKLLVVTPLEDIIKRWSGSQLREISFSGSRAKGTAINMSSDIDLFISLKSDTTETLKEIYESLNTTLMGKNYSTRRQNVSIGISHLGHSIDLIPAKNHSGNTHDHSLFRSKMNSWTKTNVVNHINIVKNSGRIDEIVALKIWRKLHELDFPSIYLELTVLNALYYKKKYQPAANFVTVLEYLRDSFVETKVIDPSNSNNVISDDLYKYEKQAVAKAAKEHLGKNWQEIIW